MKAHQCILVCLLAVMLCACDTTTREARRMVKQAELLADTLPDSTVRLIDSVLHMPVYFSERERMDMALLQAEALFGDHGQDISPVMDDDFFDSHDNLSPSPELERAAAYFAQKKQYAKAAHAALYSGFVQQHYDEKEAAMRSFKEAEQYGKLVDDSISVARAQFRIGKMLYDDYRSEEALALLKESGIHYGLSYGERAYVRNMEAIAYITLNQFDQAEKSLEKSLNYAEQAQTAKVKIKVLNNYAVLRRLEGKYDEAIAYLKQIKEFPSLSGSEKALLYLNLGKVFLAQNKSDSAAYYYHQLEEILPTDQVKDETKASSYGTLSRLAEIQGDTALAFQYLKRLEEPMSVIQATIEKQTVFRIQQQYDYESLQNEMNQKLIRRQRLVTFIGLLAIIGLAALAISQIRLAKTRKQEAEIKASLLDFIQKNKELTQKNERIEEYKSAYEDCAAKLSEAQIKEQHIMQKLAVYLDNDKDAALLGSLRQTIMGNGDYWDAMTKAFDKQFPGMRKELESQHPDLSDKEQKILLLSFVDTSREDTALLLKTSIHMVDKLRNSVRKKMAETTR